MAVDGASIPVASAMATGNARTTASIAERPGSAEVAAWPVAWGEVKPRISTATEMMTNATVMKANSSRPPCPNQVSPATTTSSRSAIGMRSGASPGKRAMTALAAAAIEMPMVSTKSTTSAPMGRNVQRAPNAARPLPLRRRPWENAARAASSWR